MVEEQSPVTSSHASYAKCQIAKKSHIYFIILSNGTKVLCASNHVRRLLQDWCSDRSHCDRYERFFFKTPFRIERIYIR